MTASSGATRPTGQQDREQAARQHPDHTRDQQSRRGDGHVGLGRPQPAQFERQPDREYDSDEHRRGHRHRQRRAGRRPAGCSAPPRSRRSSPGSAIRSTSLSTPCGPVIALAPPLVAGSESGPSRPPSAAPTSTISDCARPGGSDVRGWLTEPPPTSIVCGLTTYGQTTGSDHVDQMTSNDSEESHGQAPAAQARRTRRTDEVQEARTERPQASPGQGPDDL